MPVIPVIIQTTASKQIGEVDAETKDDFLEKANKLWEEKGFDSPRTNIHDDFDLHDWDIDESCWDFTGEA